MPIPHVLTSALESFFDQVLRGIGQVMLQDNPVTGLLFLVGIFVGDWISGVYALLGTIVATGTALLLGAPQSDVDRGLFGLNDTLTALGLTYYLGHEATLVIYVIVASMFVTIVTAAIQDIFGAQGHALTGPFVITTWIFLGAGFIYSHLYGAPALAAPHLSAAAARTTVVLHPADTVVAILNGVAQVMLQQSVWTGAIFLLALAVNSRISCAAAACGSAFGVGVAWFLGAPPIAIREGLFGFNAVLTAIALGGLFFLLHRTTVLVTILAACVSTVLYGSFTVFLNPLGLPALTAPFVLTTWLCLLARASLARLDSLSPAEATTPEGNLRAARRARQENR